MKIIEVLGGVKSSMFNDDIISRTLSHSKFGDDFINNHSFISVKIKLEDDKDYCAFLFRRLWECVYLKATQYSYILDSDEGVCAIIKMSLSESIRIIDSLTPPVLKSKLQEFTQSVDHITTVLNDFLFDPKAGEYYRDAFIKSIDMYEFPYTSNYDDRRIERLMSITGNVEACDVIASSVSINNMINEDTDWANIAATITFVINTQNVRSLCAAMNSNYHITSVVSNAYGVKVRCVNNSFGSNDDYILNIIKNTYKDIMGR